MMRNDFLPTFLKSGTILSSKPGTVLLGWGKRTWVDPLSLPSFSSQPLFYFPDYFLESEASCFYHAYTEEISIEQLLILLMNSFNFQAFPFIHWHFSSKKNLTDFQTKHFFYGICEILKKLFDKTSLQKVVPYLFESAHYLMTQERLGVSLIHVLKKVSKYPLFLYGFWDFEREDFPYGILGATPEILAVMENSTTLKTAAVAGTAASHQKESLLKDSKLLEEHQWVVEGIIEALSPFGKISQEATQIVDLGSLSHLKTHFLIEMSSKISPNMFLNLISVLHPTPALGGFPKKEAFEWLKSNATMLAAFPRGRFGAPVGYIYRDQSICYVAIRNVQWEGEKMHIGAGCGIVKESEKEAEWEEILLKFHAIKNLLNL